MGNFAFLGDIASEVYLPYWVNCYWFPRTATLKLCIDIDINEFNYQIEDSLCFCFLLIFFPSAYQGQVGDKLTSLVAVCTDRYQYDMRLPVITCINRKSKTALNTETRLSLSVDGICIIQASVTFNS